jgi:lipopolysaccharide/colanic/teichoic acid biosynthesis glycosyltransferase
VLAATAADVAPACAGARTASAAPVVLRDAHAFWTASIDAAEGWQRARRVTLYERWWKRPLDLVLAATLLAIFSPVLAAVAVAVRLSVGRPVIFRQERVGLGGRPVVIHKFRTMHPDRRTTHRHYDGPERRRCHKVPDDPRLTRVGRLLRKWSLDELPQLWDVLTGDLSIVGPRPEIPDIVAAYEPWQHKRHTVKPGLTGLWQVTARGDGAMHEHTDIDVAYVERVTLRGDLKILLLTVPAIVAGRGH